MKQVNGLIKFIHREDGGVTAIFMIMLPMMLVLFALAFDGSRVMMKRARLADGLNEAALAIAAGTSGRDTDDPTERNNAMLRRYIQFYLPGDEIITANVGRREPVGPSQAVDKGDTIFDIKAEIKFNTILPMSSQSSFAPTLNMANGGSVRKNLSMGRPADYVFVIDFSSSMYDPSSEPGTSRIDLLKRVIKDISDKALKEQPLSTFGFVPFETGVPVKMEGTNDAGGDKLGCSALFVPNAGFDIDYAFWADKDLSEDLVNNLPAINRRLDLSRYNYFNNIVRTSLGFSSMKQLMTNPYNYCVLNTNQHVGVLAAMVPYHCESDADKSIYTVKHQDIIKREYEDAYNVRKKGATRSIFNYNSINYAATLENMFDESAVITFEQVGNPHESSVYYNPFFTMCSSKGAEYSNITEYKRNTYLVELTRDKTVIEQFQHMYPNGGTESSVGLVRAVPVLTKGHNPRKVMIVISDGYDLIPMVRDAFHKDHNVCEKIRKGIPKHSPGTEEVSIHFISIAALNTNDPDVKYWGEHCTGVENSVVATNYAELMKKLVEITNNNEETGFFHVD